MLYSFKKNVNLKEEDENRSPYAFMLQYFSH